jgi:hypothetical protein
VSSRIPLIFGFVVLLAAGAAFSDADSAEGQLRWWKGNLHTHTFWSDGDDFPDMVADWYRNHGYHFLALSDHNVLSRGERWVPERALRRKAGVDALGKYRKRFGDRWVELRGSEQEGTLEVRLKPLDEVRTLVEERSRFLMLESEEITGAAADGRRLHMNATNIGELIPFVPGATVRDTMIRNLVATEEQSRRTGRDTLLHVNHPNYHWGVTAEDLAAVVPERFFEVWNGVDNDNDPGDSEHPDTDRMWDIANILRMTRYDGEPLYGLATDDTHEYHGNKTRALPGRAWIMVRARYLTPESLVRAIRAGEFYSSTGVALEEIRYDKSRRTLTLRIQPSGSEQFVTRFIGAHRSSKEGEVLAEVKGTTPSYTVAATDKDLLYLRAIVTSTGTPEVESSEHPFKRAWTQPVGWDRR